MEGRPVRLLALACRLSRPGKAKAVTSCHFVSLPAPRLRSWPAWPRRGWRATPCHAKPWRGAGAWRCKDVCPHSSIYLHVCSRKAVEYVPPSADPASCGLVPRRFQPSDGVERLRQSGGLAFLPWGCGQRGRPWRGVTESCRMLCPPSGTARTARIVVPRSAEGNGLPCLAGWPSPATSRP